MLMDMDHEGRVRVGLCADCRFVRVIKSDRDVTYYMCQLSATDPRFPKYPRVPVLQCMGYTPAQSHTAEMDKPAK